jgi:hypothetical protein
MTFLVLAALLAVPPPKAPAPAAEVTQSTPPLSDQEVQQRVRTLLGNIDTRGLAGQWKALGPRAADILEPIAQNAAEFPSTRAKAVDGLVLAAPERAAPLVTKLALDEEQPVTVRRAALRGVGRTASAATAAKSIAKVLRTARDLGVRSAAAEVIAASGSSGCAQVREQVAREEPDVRLAYGRALSRCGE